MSEIKSRGFVELLRRSALLPEERLESLLRDLPEPHTDATIAEALRTAGLATAWQVGRLRAGKYRGFFLGKYKILRPIGSGGMGSVYLAEHTRLGSQVAIKVLARKLTTVKSYLQRFYQEARVAAQLNHPHIVRAFDVDTADDLHYIVMEFVDGHDLFHVVADGGPLEPMRAADFIRQGADGLAYAHQRNLIHRDVKPSNLILDDRGTVKILDLGLARCDWGDPSLTLEYNDRMIGTVDYLAPEQAVDSHRIDSQADVYSLGGTLYFLLTGRPPFPEGTIAQRVLAHQTKEPTPIASLRDDVPEELARFCSLMMSKQASERPTALDVRDWLAALVRTGAGSAPPLPVRPTARLASRPAPPQSKVNTPTDDDDLTLAPCDDDEKRPANELSRQEASRATASSAMQRRARKEAAGEAAKEHALESPAPPPRNESSLLELLDELEATASDTSRPLPPVSGGTTSFPLPTGAPVGAPTAGAPPDEYAALASYLPAGQSRSEDPAETRDGPDWRESYPLWFLIVAGVLLGIVAIAVLHSYSGSFEKVTPSKPQELRNHD